MIAIVLCNLTIVSHDVTFGVSRKPAHAGSTGILDARIKPISSFADTCRTDHQRMNIAGVNHGSGVPGTADHDSLRKRDFLCLVLL